MRWTNFARLEPNLAELGRAKLGAPGVVLVGTIRHDGSPRLSPVEPLFWKSDLWLSLGWHTRKAADLQRDARILVHSIVTGREGDAGEYKVRGQALRENDLAMHRDYAQTVKDELGWQPVPGKSHLVRVDVEDVTFIRWDSATNDQYVSRWPAGAEYVRRGTSATSLGEPETIEGLLVRRSAD